MGDVNTVSTVVCVCSNVHGPMNCTDGHLSFTHHHCLLHALLSQSVEVFLK